MAPEHRLSLFLKQQELEKKTLSDSLGQLLQERSFIDLFDESDAILSHKYQLVYAVGNAHSLVDLEARITVMHALLRVLNSSQFRPHLVRKSHVIIDNNTPFGKWAKIRHAPADNAIRRKRRSNLRRQLFDELISLGEHDLPRELHWLIEWRGPKDGLRRVVLDPKEEFSPDQVQFDLDVHRQQVRMLRGCLAHELLDFALEQRHRVDYGLRDGAKRLAVPFRAADVPAERAEFAHPDIALLLTTIAYYYAGLTMAQLREAVRALQALGPVAQAYHYRQWLRHVPADTVARDTIDQVDKIDLTNEAQFTVLYNVFRDSCEVINWFMCACVLPRDTAQYPRRIVATSWDLTSAGAARGFSGTNDQYRLLPLHVKQHDPDDRALRATNGRMLAQLSRHTRSCNLADAAGRGSARTVLDHALSLGLDAIIDTGSLLAGTGNEEAAEYLLNSSKLNDRYAGVSYADVTGGWVIMERESHRVTSLIDSPIDERDTFVIFDAARSRGADLKLHNNAVALVTLGQRLTKDSLMQGIGRMRQLGYDQKIELFGLLELSSPIGNVINVTTILKWVMKNTQMITISGLGQWSIQGLLHCQGSQSPLYEVVQLDKLYDGARYQGLLGEAIESQSRCYKPLIQRNHLHGAIVAHTQKFGADVRFLSSTIGEECEREIQLEQEEEEEREVTLQKVDPAIEHPWSYEKCLNVTTLKGLCDQVVHGVAPQRLIDLPLSPSDLSRIHWANNLHVSASFLRTVIGPPSTTIPFMRIVHAVLQFPDGAVLALSDMEADGVLGKLRNVNNKKCPQLLNLSTMGAIEGVITEEKSIATMRLFNGETTFDNRSVLTALLQDRSAKLVIRQLIQDRGRNHSWHCSDVEAQCI